MSLVLPAVFPISADDSVFSARIAAAAAAMTVAAAAAAGPAADAATMTVRGSAWVETRAPPPSPSLPLSSPLSLLPAVSFS
jgi:hypothetical protein